MNVRDALFPVIHNAKIDGLTRLARQNAHGAIGNLQQMCLATQCARTQTKQFESQPVFFGFLLLLGVAEINHGLEQSVCGGLRGHGSLGIIAKTGATFFRQCFKH
ncbi:hypothetical protein D3C80_1261650 [compost metagenome]